MFIDITFYADDSAPAQQRTNGRNHVQDSEKPFFRSGSAFFIILLLFI